MNVHQSLEALRAELERAQLSDAEKQRRLDEFNAHVGRVLDPEDADAQPVSLIDRINDLLVEFDHDHPGVAAALRTALNILNESGV